MAPAVPSRLTANTNRLARALSLAGAKRTFFGQHAPCDFLSLSDARSPLARLVVNTRELDTRQSRKSNHVRASYILRVYWR